ncbi:MAG: NfeD family protein [Deltaproteobacteria bacterium]|jgi:membrane protein implicated in regulation of membrane protease activity|nr:NfeD family protein [Deltaproteobacteria bacterium]
MPQLILGQGPFFWFCLGFVLFIMEIATPGVFFLFFGLGAWCVMFLNMMVPVPPWAQWGLFVIVSVTALVLLRRNVIAYLAARKVSKTDSLSEPMVAERYLGQEVDVLTDLAPGRPGTVEFNGTRWQARCGSVLKGGARGRIVDLDGLTFLVEPLTAEGAEAPSPAPAADAVPETDPGSGGAAGA